jgi:hypothetical protein
VAALGPLGCGASAREVRKATTSAYDADFAIVFSQTLIAVRTLYPHYEENPSAGWIKTAWHPLQVSQGQDTADQGIEDPQDPSNPFRATRAPFARFYIRFRVHVVGGRPWRVRVEGEASSWEAGAIPTPLRGAETPHWLKGRTEALQVAIYRRLRAHAVPVVGHRAAAPPRADEATLAQFGDLPAAAARVVADVHAAAIAGDFIRLRAHMADDFVWSLGAAPGADHAIVMLQADPTLVSQLIAALAAGCSAAGAPARVTCPPADAPLAASRHLATFADVGGTWKMVSFLVAD